MSAKSKLKANKTPYKLYSLYKALNYNSDIMSVILDLNLAEDWYMILKNLLINNTNDL